MYFYFEKTDKRPNFRKTKTNFLMFWVFRGHVALKVYYQLSFRHRQIVCLYIHTGVLTPSLTWGKSSTFKHRQSCPKRKQSRTDEQAACPVETSSPVCLITLQLVLQTPHSADHCVFFILPLVLCIFFMIWNVCRIDWKQFPLFTGNRNCGNTSI